MAKVEFKVPTWVEKRYSLLWDALDDSEFNIEQAARILEEKNKDKKKKYPCTFQKSEKPDGLPTNRIHLMQEKEYIS